MTVIRPNSISGITSITAQANEINVFRSNGLIAGLNLNGVNFNTTSGISTFAALNIEGVLTYQDVTNVDSIGLITARSGINVTGGQLDVGSNIKIGNAGVITATTFSGSGASLTGIANANISASAAIGGEKINPAFTSNVTITNTAPRLDFVESNNNSDYRITNSNGTFVFYDTTNAATRLSIASNGNVSVTNDLDVDGHTELDLSLIHI